MDMKCYQIGMYEKAVPETYSLPDMLRFAKEAGYDFFEISIDRTDKRISRLYDDQFLQSIKQGIEEIDFPIGSMCLSALGTYTLGNTDPQIAMKAIDIFSHAVRFAEATGIRIIQIPACDVPKNDAHTADTDSNFLCNLKKLVEYASAHSIMIGFENMEDTYMDNIEKNMRIINAIHSPYFLLYSDAGNITSAAKKYGNDIKKDMLLGKNKYCAFHLKETRVNKYGGLFYGEGHVDFERIMNIAWNDLDIRRYVLEYWYTGNPGWKQDLITAREFCEEWIRKSNNE